VLFFPRFIYDRPIVTVAVKQALTDPGAAMRSFPPIRSVSGTCPAASKEFYVGWRWMDNNSACSLLLLATLPILLAGLKGMERRRGTREKGWRNGKEIEEKKMRGRWGKEKTGREEYSGGRGRVASAPKSATSLLHSLNKRLYELFFDCGRGSRKGGIGVNF